MGAIRLCLDPALRPRWSGVGCPEAGRYFIGALVDRNAELAPAGLFGCGLGLFVIALDLFTYEAFIVPGEFKRRP